RAAPPRRRARTDRAGRTHMRAAGASPTSPTRRRSGRARPRDGRSAPRRSRGRACAAPAAAEVRRRRPRRRPASPRRRRARAPPTGPQRPPTPPSDSRSECIPAACGKIPAAMTDDRYVYDFDEDAPGGRELLGGKGVGLTEMTQLGVPVPAGFTITTAACRAAMALGGELPPGLAEEVE